MYIQYIATTTLCCFKLYFFKSFNESSKWYNSTNGTIVVAIGVLDNTNSDNSVSSISYCRFSARNTNILTFSGSKQARF